MFDKLLVRVRSWLHAGPQPAGAAAGEYRGLGSPPPLPPDAWMESESGMVITESGIIIIDPALADAGVPAAPPPTPRGVPADRAWAMPTMPRAGGSSTLLPVAGNAARSVTPNEDLDWDEVLARARANIARPPQGPPLAAKPETRVEKPEKPEKSAAKVEKVEKAETPPTRNGRSRRK